MRPFSSLSSTLVPLALLYGALLVQSWQPDTLSLIMPGSLSDGLAGGFRPQFFPRLDTIALLFSRSVATAASMWVHLQVRARVYVRASVSFLFSIISPCHTHTLSPVRL